MSFGSAGGTCSTIDSSVEEVVVSSSAKQVCTLVTLVANAIHRQIIIFVIIFTFYPAKQHALPAKGDVVLIRLSVEKCRPKKWVGITLGQNI